MKLRQARTPTAALAILILGLSMLQATPSAPRSLGVITPGYDRNLIWREVAAWPADLPAADRFSSSYTAAMGLSHLMGGRSSLFSSADLASATQGQVRHLGLFQGDLQLGGRRELLKMMPFGAILAAAGERNRVDSLLLAAVVEAESQFLPHAVSPCGAVGLMQLLPATGHDFGIANLLDPQANVEAGSRYLRALLDRFRGRPDLAIAAYNAGPEVVARFGCVPPFRETQEFVKRVLGRYGTYKNDLNRRSLDPHDVLFAGVPSSGGSSSGREESSHALSAGSAPTWQIAAR
jgi:hypothetical protein